MPEKKVDVPVKVKVEDLNEQLANLLSTKAQSAGKQNQALVFEKIARENGGVVTTAQAKAANPKQPSDLAYYFRQALGKCTTTKGKGDSTFWTVTAYPADVKAEIERVKAAIAQQTK